MYKLPCKDMVNSVSRSENAFHTFVLCLLKFQRLNRCIYNILGDFVRSASNLPITHAPAKNDNGNPYTRQTTFAACI